MQLTPIQMAMAAAVSIMSALAAAFWGVALLAGGPRAVIAALPITAMALFTMAHLPTMAAAILLWRAGVAQSWPLLRWGLFVAMIYFSAACILSVFGNFLAASVLGLIG